MKLTELTDIFNIRGMVLPGEPMWRHTTFAVGGAADIYAVPEDADDLALLLTTAQRLKMPVFVLGGGSNLLVSDRGIRGLVIDTQNFREYHLESGEALSRDPAARPVKNPSAWSNDCPGTSGGALSRDPAARPVNNPSAWSNDFPGTSGGALSRDPAAAAARPSGTSPGATVSPAALNTPNAKTAAAEILVLGAGLDISSAAWRAGSQGLAGLEMFFAMPGSVGGAIWMNARCYGGEIADSLLWADVMLPGGRLQRVEKRAEEWGYKKSPFQESEAVILRGAFAVIRKNPGELRSAMRDNRNHREERGHFRAPCAGSTFKNNRQFGEPSGALIDRCGLKGQRSGGAAVSSWHGNILINDGGASAGDIRTLINQVADEVEKRTGFRMEPEVQMAGDWD